MINLALVGVGPWGKNIFEEISSIPDCNLKYICAQNDETLTSFSDKYIKVQDFHKLFEYRDIDGVIIATPGSTHFKVASEFIDRGYNIFIEKPMTTNYQDALSLQKIVQSKESVVLVGHIYLYNPAILKIKQLLPSIGSIQYMTFEGLNNGTFRSDMSVLWEWAPHGVSICLDFFQQKPIAVSAWIINKLRPQTKLYDMFYLNLEFPNKITAIIKGSWLYPIKKRELVVVGSNSTIVFDNYANHKLTLYENIGPSVQGDKVIKNEPNISYPEYDKQSPLRVELLEFIGCIKNKSIPKADIDHGVEVVRIIDLAEQSIQNSGQVIPFK